MNDDTDIYELLKKEGAIQSEKDIKNRKINRAKERKRQELLKKSLKQNQKI